MNIEILSSGNINHLVELVLELWPGCTFEEEVAFYKSIISSDTEICYLAREQATYMAFIHVSIRTDYVEGATALPIAYVEALYVKSPYQKRGVGKKLVDIGADWGREKGCKQVASDTELDNSASIDFHTKIGFTEANRIVCFIKDI